MTNLNFNSGAIVASDCVANGWELVKRNLGLYLGVGLVALLLLSCIPLVNFLLLGPVMGGFSYIVLRDMRNEPIDFGMLFKGFEKFLPLMVVGIIQAVPGIIFQIMQWTMDLSRIGLRGIGGESNEATGLGPLQTGLFAGFFVVFFGYLLFQLIWNAALLFAIPLIIENEISIGEAIRLSLSAVFANLGGIILLMILSAVVVFLGLLVLCVGIFVAIPVTWAANVFAYRQVFPLLDRTVHSTPPPPSAYGSSFGQGM